MSLAESALATVSRVGPYFSAVSLIPSAVLVVNSAVMIAAQPWTGYPQWGRALGALFEMGWQALLLGGLATVLVAFLLHPFQFAHVQLMEGYWGNSALALRLAELAIRAHHAALKRTYKAESAAADDLKSRTDTTRAERATTMYAQAAHAKEAANYPEALDEVMPTRFGNVLRRYERLAGHPYGLDAITTVPLLVAVARPDQVAYLNDQRTQMDLAARFSTVFMILAIECVGLLLGTGWWLMLAAVAYAISWMFYRGAVTQAHLYGNAMTSLVDLNRFELYRHLGMSIPATVAGERKQNRALEAQLGERSRNFDYRLHVSQEAAPRSTD